MSRQLDGPGHATEDLTAIVACIGGRRLRVPENALRAASVLEKAAG